MEFDERYEQGKKQQQHGKHWRLSTRYLCNWSVIGANIVCFRSRLLETAGISSVSEISAPGAGQGGGWMVHIRSVAGVDDRGEYSAYSHECAHSLRRFEHTWRRPLLHFRSAH